MTYRILVTGSRDWTDSGRVYTELARAAHESGAERVVVIHGDASSGADLFADTWARAEDRATPAPRPADWARYGKPAGNIRNTQMAEEEDADICLAFQEPCRAPRCKRPRPHDSHGTADCVAKAVAAGITVRIFR